MYKSYGTIRAFNEISWSDFIRLRSNQIIDEIESRSKEYILEVDEEEYKTYLFEKYSLEPLEIVSASETIDEPIISKEWIEGRFGRRYQREVYSFTVRYKFMGTGILLAVRPDSGVATSYEITGSEENSTIGFDFKLYNRDPEEFRRIKSNCYTAAFANIGNINKNVEGWNNSLKSLVSSSFDSLKTKYLEENKFFEAINVKVNKNTKSIFTAPTIKKKNNSSTTYLFEEGVFL